MVYAYRTGVRVDLDGNAPRELGKLAKVVLALVADSKKLNLELKKLEGNLTKAQLAAARMTHDMRALAFETRGAAGVMETLSKATKSIGANVRGATDFTKVLSRETQEVAARWNRVGDAAALATTKINEAAAASAKVGEINLAEGALAGRGRRGGRTPNPAEEEERVAGKVTGKRRGYNPGRYRMYSRGMRGFDAMGLGLGVEFMPPAVLAAAGVAYEGFQAAKGGAELAHEQALLHFQGNAPDQVKRATLMAQEASLASPGTSIVDNLKQASDLRSVLGSLDAALQPEIFKKLVRLGLVLSTVTGGKSGDAAYMAAKAEDIRGALIDPKTGKIDSQQYLREIDSLAKVVIQTRGRIDPGDFLAFQKQARISGMLLAPDELYEKIPALMQNLNPGKVGTALNSMATQLLGGVGMQKVAAEWNRLDLLATVKRDKKGKIIGGTIKNEEMFISHPLEYMVGPMAEAIKKAVGDSPEKMNKELYNLLGRQNVSGLVGDIIRNITQINLQGQLIHNSPDIDKSLSTLLDEDPLAGWKAFTAAMGNFNKVAGLAGAKDVGPFLLTLSNDINEFALRILRAGSLWHGILQQMHIESEDGSSTVKFKKLTPDEAKKQADENARSPSWWTRHFGFKYIPDQPPSSSGPTTNPSVHHEAYITGHDGGRMSGDVMMGGHRVGQITLTLDQRAMGRGVAGALAREGILPDRGGTRYDPSMIPGNPGTEVYSV